VQQFSVFTSSSHLTSLQLDNKHRNYFYATGQLLADGAAQYMFPEGKHLLHLKQLVFSIDDIEWSEREKIKQPFGAGDVARLAAACPALEHLEACYAVQAVADINSLAQLTGLTHLKLGGQSLSGSQLSAVLVKLRKLQKLWVMGVPRFGPAEVAALTQLTGLRILLVDDGDSKEADKPLQGSFGRIDLLSRVRRQKVAYSCCCDNRHKLASEMVVRL
jgi:hypothetical protein